jgi:hypothetical protein
MRHLPILLAMLVPACGAPLATPAESSADRVGDLTLLTDRSAYKAVATEREGPVRAYRFTLVARFTNHTDRPVYLERCYPDTPYPIHGIVPAEGDAEVAYAPVWACVEHGHPIEVQPGETRTDSLRITGPNAWDGDTNEAFGRLEGRFRLSYSVGTCPAVIGCEVPGRVRESNEFVVRLGR